MLETFSHWSGLLLAAVLVADVGMSVRPLRFIRDCLEGVRFPEGWWWALLVVKSMAAVGLVAGTWSSEVRATVAIGVVAYFLCAAIAHVRARFFGTVFWVNCMGMLAFSSVTAYAAIVTVLA